MTIYLSIAGFVAAVLIALRQNKKLRWSASVHERLNPIGSVKQASSVSLNTGVSYELNSGIISYLKRTMYRAALRGGDAALISAVLVCAILALISSVFFMIPIFWIVALTCMAAYLPILVVAWIGARRVRRLEGQLADTLDSIIGALQSGMGFRQALEIARTNRKGPITETLSEIMVLADFGTPLSEGFRMVAHRLKSKHFSSFAATVIASYESGGSLTPMLAGLAVRIRDGIRLRRRVQTLTSEARFSAVILFLMPYLLALFIYSQICAHAASSWSILDGSPFKN
jgi:tight adherence protein B